MAAIPNELTKEELATTRHKMLAYDEVVVKAGDGKDPDVAGEIEGKAGGLLNIDRGEDIIFPGATTDTKEQFLKDGVVAYQHDFTSIIGKPLTLDEKLEPDYGILTRAEIISTSLGADVMKLVKRQVLKYLSIGYRITKDGYAILNRETLLATLRERVIVQSKIDQILGDFDKRKLETVFALFKIDLLEYSVVTRPMNPEAAITGAKGEFAGLLDGLNFSLHPALVLAANRGYVKRATDLFERLKAPEGKALGEAHLDALRYIATEGGDLAKAARELLEANDLLKSGGSGGSTGDTALVEEYIIAEAVRAGHITLD